jgi:hypothetical protein
MYREKCHDKLPHNNYLISYPLLLRQNKNLICPFINTNKLLINNMGITNISLQTLNYVFLKELDISDNNIRYMPEIISLKILKCNNCNIDKLPDFQPALEILECCNNNITKIPFYKELTSINCSTNLIKNIPFLPKLTHLTCCNNPITSISNSKLVYLKARNCPLIIVHKIPSLIKKSSIMVNNKFKWLYEDKQDIDRKYVVLDWNTGLNKINITNFSNYWKKIFILFL